MSRSLNCHQVIGYLGADPVLKESPIGLVASFAVATSEQWKDKTSGEKKDRSNWHSVVMYDKLAETARDYLKKGNRVYLSGRVQTRKWQDKAGMDRYTTEIIAKELIFLEKPDIHSGEV